MRAYADGRGEDEQPAPTRLRSVLTAPAGFRRRLNDHVPRERSRCEGLDRSPPRRPSVTGSSAAIRDVSWADSQHGWKAGCGVDAGCVLSTENGGRTWHRIGRFEVQGLVRTSARAGLVVGTGHPGPITWWTRDNGRHWYEANPRVIPASAVGNARFLFWHTRTQLFQVRPWPPRGRQPPNCRFRCRWNGGSRSVGVARSTVGQFAGIANLPGGVLAVIDSGDDAVVSRVLLRQGGRNTTMSLPLAQRIRPCSNFYGAEPVVDWPKIAVFGCTGTSADKAVTWISEDGGRTWRVYRP